MLSGAGDIWCHRQAGAARQGNALRVGELPLDEQPTLLGAVGRFVQRLQLQVGVLNRLQVALQLRRHLAGVALAIVLELLFLFDETPLRFRELRVQELAGVVGLGLSVFRVLVDVERGQTLGDLPCRFGVVADVADAKRVDVSCRPALVVTSRRIIWTTSSMTPALARPCTDPSPG